MAVLQAGLWIAGTFSLSHEEGIGNQCHAGPVFRRLCPIRKGVKLRPTFGRGETCQEDCLKGESREGALARGWNGAECMERAENECQVPTWRRSARVRAFGLKLVDEAGEEMFVCDALTGDLLQSVNDGSAITGNCHWSKHLGGQQKGQEVSQDGSSDSEWIVSSVLAPLCENAPFAVVD